jgi:hypothetical protein
MSQESKVAKRIAADLKNNCYTPRLWAPNVRASKRQKRSRDADRAARDIAEFSWDPERGEVPRHEPDVEIDLADEDFRLPVLSRQTVFDKCNTLHRQVAMSSDRLRVMVERANAHEDHPKKTSSGFLSLRTRDGMMVTFDAAEDNPDDFTLKVTVSVVDNKRSVVASEPAVSVEEAPVADEDSLAEE